MNTPNPLVPQGTLPDKGKAQIRITVFAILAVHLVALGVLLIAGCNPKKADPEPTADTGVPPLPPIPADTNWPAPPTGVPPVPVTPDATQLPPPVPTPTQEVTAITPLPISPVTPPPPQDPVATGSAEHTISKGESFYTIGKKYGVGFKAIADANPGVNPNRLKIGQKIAIPAGKAPAGAATALAPAPTAGDTMLKSYKVKSGDNLNKIAKSHGVSAKQLRAANNLKTDQIKVGQSLKIPVKASAVVAPPVEAAPPVPAPPAEVPPTAFPPAGAPVPPTPVR